jgi:hypothetical protein
VFTDLGKAKKYYNRNSKVQHGDYLPKTTAFKDTEED